jgi:hypothetical protein
MAGQSQRDLSLAQLNPAFIYLFLVLIDTMVNRKENYPKISLKIKLVLNQSMKYSVKLID